MRRVVLAIAVVILVVVVVSAQPALPPATPPVPVAPPVVPPPPPGDATVPAPPKPLPVPGAPTSPPAVPIETPLSKYQPLSAFPVTTQFSVQGVLLGSAWMATMHQPHGRFLHGYNPALRKPMSGEHDLLQARCALAMAQAARFTGDPKQTALASQAVLALLAATKLDPTNANIRVPVHASVVCNRVGFAALLALAIYDLPGAVEKLTDDAERLCAFLRAQLRADGSVHYTDAADDVSAQVNPTGLNEYPGLALQALAVSNRHRPAEWKKDAVQKGVAHYGAIFRKQPHPLLAATITPAAVELYTQSKLNDLAAVAFEMTDWLCALQIPATDPRTPQWAGGFRVIADGQATTEPPGAVESALILQSLACGYQLTRVSGDLARERKYRPALAGAVEFLCGLQFLEANTRHFENSFRSNVLIGAFHLSPADGNLRTDATACAVSGLLRYLACGAEGR